MPIFQGPYTHKSNWPDTESILHNQAKVHRARTELNAAIEAFEVDVEAFNSVSMANLLTALRSIKTILDEGRE